MSYVSSRTTLVVEKNYDYSVTYTLDKTIALNKTVAYLSMNNHSTNHALISLTEKIRKVIDGKFARGVLLDFQKAFDTVNHKT